MMNRTAFALASAAALGAFALALPTAPASAQLSQSGGPVSYSADNLEYFDTEHRLVLTGDVDVVQNDSRLRANQITLFFSASTAAPQSNASQPVRPQPSVLLGATKIDARLYNSRNCIGEGYR